MSKHIKFNIVAIYGLIMLILGGLLAFFDQSPNQIIGELALFCWGGHTMWELMCLRSRWLYKAGCLKNKCKVCGAPIENMYCIICGAYNGKA